MIPYANGVDDEFSHGNILELLIKEKIMAIKKTNASNRTFKNLFSRKSRSGRSSSTSNNAEPQAVILDEKKLNIAIVELPKDYYIQTFDEQPVIINIEDPIFTQGGLDSISLYNIEITGDRLIDYNIDTQRSVAIDEKLKANIDNNYSSDNQSVNSASYANLSSAINRSNAQQKAAQKRHESLLQIGEHEDFCLDYEFVQVRNLSQHRKHSLETIVPRIRRQHSFRDSARTGMNLGDISSFFLS